MKNAAERATAELPELAIEEIQTKFGRIRPRNAMRLPTDWDAEGQVYSVQYEPWSLDIFAPSAALLSKEFREQMRMLWVEYAMAPDEELSPAAARVKARLLRDWVEVRDAA